MLAVDAFTSDAVPMHLLTREALAVYGRAVQRDGIVLFHISNRYLDLKPVVADIAASRRLGERDDDLSADRRGGGPQRHHLGLDRLVAQPADAAAADRG